MENLTPDSYTQPMVSHIPFHWAPPPPQPVPEVEMIPEPMHLRHSQFIGEIQDNFPSEQNTCPDCPRMLNQISLLEQRVARLENEMLQIRKFGRHSSVQPYGSAKYQIPDTAVPDVNDSLTLVEIDQQDRPQRNIPFDADYIKSHPPSHHYGKVIVPPYIPQIPQQEIVPKVPSPVPIKLQPIKPKLANNWWSTLSRWLPAKNMHLPDELNPTIIWDEKNGMWVDTEEMCLINFESGHDHPNQKILKKLLQELAAKNTSGHQCPGNTRIRV